MKSNLRCLIKTSINHVYRQPVPFDSPIFLSLKHVDKVISMYDTENRPIPVSQPAAGYAESQPYLQTSDKMALITSLAPLYSTV